MAEFPAKVSTQTSTPEASSSRGSLGFVSLDVGFFSSIPGILMAVEIALGLLVWALIADSNHPATSAYGWVLFVSVTCWLVTLLVFVVFILHLQRKLAFVPWSLVLLIYHAAATLLYITAFITCAASIQTTTDMYTAAYNKKSAASFFACMVMIAYGASTFFSFLIWRGSGSNAATDQA
ncbi:hypothetical protein XENTR_v10011720 [Xenopus tropicalis]|uniref:Plasmolipin n=1 Tax=Xenopus tropicalis TaxID=8364 RepID=F7ENT9_XENTR|nr:plasmolipin [Xenopus tropicalis]KAE8609131.1 hypothetical protein XENTR_v10011720 [Xenopus tropicalis]|eukprot:XP_002931714.1 PREDICTED: plasmolipin [Xenopus tropicalis]